MVGVCGKLSSTLEKSSIHRPSTIVHNAELRRTILPSAYAYVRTLHNIENLSVMSLARFPESVQLRKLCKLKCFNVSRPKGLFQFQLWNLETISTNAVHGTQQVFWLIAPDIQPSQFIKNQWLSRFWISDCESQQRDCAGISPASLTLNAVQR